MGQPIIYFVVANGNHIRSQQVHDLNGGNSLKLRIDQGALEHISGYGIDHVFFFPANLIDVPGEHGHAAYQFIVHVFYQKIAVQIV